MAHEICHAEYHRKAGIHAFHESYIAQEFARCFAEAEEEAFITGDGSGKPLGVLAAAGGADIGVTAAAADAIKADELIDLVYSLRSPYRKNAVFLTNDDT